MMYLARLEIVGHHQCGVPDAVKRVFGGTLCFGTKDARPGAEVWSTGRAHFFDHMRLWFRDDELGQSAGRREISSR